MDGATLSTTLIKAFQAVLRLAIVVALFLLLWACASPPTAPPVVSVEPFVERQTRSAQKAAEIGDLALARSLWLSILTVDSSSQQAKRGLASVDKAIASVVAANLREGRSAYADGDSAQGDRQMLSVLAVDPGNLEALKLLRQSVSRAAHAQQADKVRDEGPEPEVLKARRLEDQFIALLRRRYAGRDYQQVVELVRTQDMLHVTEARVLAVSALDEMAQEAQLDGDNELALLHLDSALELDQANRSLLRKSSILKQRVSDEAYKNGLALMNEDLEGAIEYFKIAIAYDPENLMYKKQLNQAQTLQQNLEKIRGR
ncbi:MAG: hypothetical protein AAGC91_06250 [Pseudomonadota bacterium]